MAHCKWCKKAVVIKDDDFGYLVGDNRISESIDLDCIHGNPTSSIGRIPFYMFRCFYSLSMDSSDTLGYHTLRDCICSVP